MNWFILALQVALVLVIVLVIWELLRLRRAVLLSQIATLDSDEVRTAAGEAESKVRKQVAETESILQETDAEAEVAPPAAEQSAEEEAAAIGESAEVREKRGPRVLSEAGRAKYDRVLELASDGMDTDSIARTVDLTRAEVELMLGPA